MRRIDMQTWSRREHFTTYHAFDHPHFGLCANVDLTAFYPVVKQRDYSFTLAVLYLVSRVANEIPEFRYRIHGDEVIEHEVVHPSTTILINDDVFSFCTFDYSEDFSLFAARGVEQIAHVRRLPTVENESRDDLLYTTSIPWVSFTSMLHPVNLSPPDSIPRIAWGKYFKEGERLKMPLGVQAHHALMDGVHMGRYYELFQKYLDQPELVFGASAKS